MTDQIDVNQRNRYGETPLILACRRRRFSIAALLLDAGADATIADSDRRTPLHWALLTSNRFDEWGTPIRWVPEHVSLVRRMVAAGASVLAQDHPAKRLPWRQDVGDVRAFGTPERMLLDCWEPDFVSDLAEVFLDAGAAPLPMLKCAIHREWRPLFDRLVSRINLRELHESDRESVVGDAVRGERNSCWPDVLSILLAIDPPLLGSPALTRLLRRAHNRELAALLLNAGAVVDPSDEDGGSVLHSAVWDAAVDVVDELLSRGADPGRPNSRNELPLKDVESALSPLTMFAYQKPAMRSILRLLVEAGALRSLTEPETRSLFHAVVRDGDVPTVSFLIERRLRADDDTLRMAQQLHKTEIAPLLTAARDRPPVDPS